MSAFGISVKYHYCMDKLAKVDVGFTANNDCKCNVPVKPQGCCKDKIFQLKSDTHNACQGIQPDSNENFVLVAEYLHSIILPEPQLVFLEAIIQSDQSQPPSPIFLLNQNFRI